MSIRSSAAEARSDLNEAVAQFSEGDADAALASIAEAREDIDDALAGVHRVDLRIARALPVVGDEVEVITASVEAASDVTSAIELIAAHLASPHPSLYDQGSVDADAAAEWASVLEQATTLMTKASELVESAPRPRLDEVADAASEVHQRAIQGAVATDAAAHLLRQVGATDDDPFRALFVFTNGAELRAIGGVPVFLAEFEVSDGDLALLQQGSTATAHGSEPVAFSSEFEALFGSFRATQLWSNVTLTSNGPSAAEISSLLYEQVTGRESDLVIITDLVALGWMLDAFPEIRVEGEPLEPTTLATDFLIDTYKRFESGVEQNLYLVETIETVFDQVHDLDLTVSTLVNGLRRGVNEGRIAVWSPTPEIQKGIVFTGADMGLVSDDGRIDVAVQNFGASKLDLFTTIVTDLDLEPVGCALLARLKVEVSESTPEPLLQVLPGPTDSNRWWVNTYLPPGGELRGLEVNGEQARGGHESWGERSVASVYVTAPLGETGTVTVEWLQPIPSSETMTLGTNATVTEPAGEVIVEVPVIDGCGVKAVR